MAKRKRKKTGGHSRSFSPVSYLMKGNARKLPIHECLLPEGWEELGKFAVIVVRRHANGNLTLANILVDLFCTGIKDALYLVNIPDYEYREMIENYRDMDLVMERCDYNLAHNIIYEALAYAEDFGIPPHNDFEIAEMILEEDTEDIPLVKIPLGRDGRPLLLLHADDPKNDFYIRQLDRSIGPDNYDVMDNDPFFFEEDEFEDEMDNPEDWDLEEWRDYLEMDIDHIVPFDEALLFIYERCIYLPAVAGRQLAATNNEKNYEFQITFDALDADRMSPEQASRNLSYFERLHDPELTKAGQRKLVSDLKAEINKDPDEPILQNYLSNALILMGDLKGAEKIQKDVIEKYPDYLFGKLSYGRNLLNQKQYEEIPKLFGGEYALPAAYPDRKVFHFSEFIGFQTLIGFYFLRTKQVEHAYLYYKTILEMDYPEEYKPPYDFIGEINMAVAGAVDKQISVAQKDPKKMEELLSLLVS